jgi:hypothetical protein
MLVNLENVTIKKKIGVRDEISKAGKEYTIGEILVEYEVPDKEYPVRLLLKAFGETAKQIKPLKEGEKVSIVICVSTRDYNGKYYTDAICEKFLDVADKTPKASPKKESKKSTVTPDPFSIKSDLNSIEDDMLPF